jgi:plastocyanin
MKTIAAFPSACAAVLAIAAIASARAQDPAVVEILVHTPQGDPVADAVVALRPQGMTTDAPAADAPGALSMSQHDLTFDPHVLIARTGADVAFPNEDDVRHHVYSFSDAKTFELRLYGGETEHVVHFDRPGLVPLGCNIHDDMIAFIYVSDTPWAIKTDEDGRALIQGAPPGDYALSVWHERLREDGEIESDFTVPASGSATQAVTVELRRPRRRRGYR